MSFVLQMVFHNLRLWDGAISTSSSSMSGRNRMPGEDVTSWVFQLRGTGQFHNRLRRITETPLKTPRVIEG